MGLEVGLQGEARLIVLEEHTAKADKKLRKGS